MRDINFTTSLHNQPGANRSGAREWGGKQSCGTQLRREIMLTLVDVSPLEVEEQ